MENFIEFEGYKYELPPFFSKERTISFIRQLADYKFISDYGIDGEVLDVGCGYGYGSFLLSLKAKKVVGVDTANEQIERAKKIYKSDNLEFLIGDATKLSSNFVAGSFDVVTAMQLIEHLQEPERFIESAKQVTNAKGIVIIATPNRLARLKDGQKPWNPDHIREYDPDSLADFLGKYFKNIEFYSMLGSQKAHEFEKTIRGGKTPSRLKTLWRYTPESIRSGIRKIIDSKLKDTEISLDDYQIVKGAQSEGMGFFAFCHKS